MLRSMTAYGRSSLKSAHGELVCELRSVNHRYLDITIRLPDDLRSIESALREKLTAKLQRGKLELIIKRSDVGSIPVTLTINQNLLQQLADAANRVGEKVGAKAAIDPVRLLQWPGVVSSNEITDDNTLNEAITVFEQALVDFIATREREGSQIAQMLENKALQMSEHVAQLRELRPVVLHRQKEKWLIKLAQLNTDHDESRLEQELVYVAQRLDIDEELDRLDAHIVELSNAVKREDAVGRRLDFLMQEFNRETNTLSSKSGDIHTTNAAVDMKVLIEQVREQVQNIE